MTPKSLSTLCVVIMAMVGIYAGAEYLVAEHEHGQLNRNGAVLMMRANAR